MESDPPSPPSPPCAEQSYHGVTISYSSNNWITPEFDYVHLLSEMSAPNNNYILFTSKVGLARIALLSAALGCCFGFHLLLLLTTTTHAHVVWSCYALALCIYHFAEFLSTCRNHPGAANSDSFLLNHSKHFTIALLASWTEFWLGTMFAPEMKFNVENNSTTLCVGLGMMIAGQLIRTGAMLQAGPSFTHLIAYEKLRQHRLVTDGIYKYLRHPAYFGWFYWSIGTQVLLRNPFCFAAYFAASWTFFKHRVEEEEELLVAMFGQEYIAYQARSFIGIPGI